MKVEIINADSRQVYRQMDIGTAKPTNAEKSIVTHHLFDLIDPDVDNKRDKLLFIFFSLVNLFFIKL